MDVYVFFTYVSTEGFKCIRAFEEAFAHPILFVGVRCACALVCAQPVLGQPWQAHAHLQPHQKCQCRRHIQFFQFFFISEFLFISSWVGRLSLLLPPINRFMVCWTPRNTFEMFLVKEKHFFFLRNIAVIWVKHGPFGDNETQHRMWRVSEMETKKNK